MKHLIAIIASGLMTISLHAQGIGASFLDKYGKDDGIEVITIGKKMLDLMLSDSIASPEMQDAIAGLESIQVISSNDTILNKNYYHSAFNLLAKSKNFVELLALNSETDNLLIMIKESKGVVSELVLLSNTEGHFNLICLRGNIRLEMIAKYSQQIDLKELKKLKFLKNNIAD
ncbi:MAG: DUF4252 domain-containing protein [Candidatus Azobacteroides sp.]|nr:DUF4252 domain-containing protein [Candidatus Azobacteroides sp.]